MTTVLKAKFDGRTIVPDGPVDLPVGETLDITVTRRTAQVRDDTNGDEGGLRGLARALAALPVDPNAPTDAAAQHDHYLYGTPKRENP